VLFRLRQLVSGARESYIALILRGPHLRGITLSVYVKFGCLVPCSAVGHGLAAEISGEVANAFFKVQVCSV